MLSSREQLDALLATLSDEQVAIVLGFAQALNRGRVVTSFCELSEHDKAGLPANVDNPTALGIG